MAANDSRKALGAFLKSVRAATRPETVGLRAGPRRRAQGLRRDEVALAAGISVTWYTWIEQGRAVSCAPKTLARIARALGMSRTERGHLFDLAGAADHRPVRLSRTIAPELAAFADALHPQPAYFVNGRWDVLYYNSACAAVLGAFDPASPITSNVLRRVFLDHEWRTRFEDWNELATSVVAQFRAATGALLRNEAFTEFVARLADESPEFRAQWESRRLAPSPLHAKTFMHPRTGRIVMDYATLKPDAAADDVRLVLYVPRPEFVTAVRGLTKDASRVSPRRIV
jgi:transcriptional regulator with XRE-family HTH domain